uniref:Uncharacterized protein n=1 Tax=Pyramimonas obovata TaxID=1411642 RepID=A0A7S0WUK7_9CHLO|mmetsp:Transcript_49/g.119  ORF Transcript_49/g.119 Transcript_49/m.119 type:complete len:148 (+) Transcript_49:283-726(+)|eukprot:CAMPEP_0118937768 /NCGR_PEP_ID=MMETSP1169-20130426/23776_1 /TAXON_ID=36882 /ORGANISM="Pyramimonas obovata, Strain CCMP722" /LENGTH=147 /DNA_ID=CAMNT_0006881509 /DNA_START=222 /DNA_END=665 /DNA_ORIENTATION=-
MLWSLTTVFRAHRFVAGASGLLLLLLPKPVMQVFCPKRSLPDEEKLVIRSWGIFVLAVATIVHKAPSFSFETQQDIGRTLAACFSGLTALYAKEAICMYRPAPGFRAQVAFTGALFGGIALAYITALISRPYNEDKLKRTVSQPFIV